MTIIGQQSQKLFIYYISQYTETLFENVEEDEIYWTSSVDQDSLNPAVDDYEFDY